MSEVTREEFDYKHKEIRENVNKLGQTMREAVKDAKETASINLKEFKTTDFKEHKELTREDFKSVWKAIDDMLLKVGIVVTITSSLVMMIFKFFQMESSK